jgi:Flp pilus assembly protein TadD
MTIAPAPVLKRLHFLALAGVAALALSACSSTKTTLSVERADYTSLSATALAEGPLGEAEALYKKKPRDRAALLAYADALRAAKKPAEAAAVLEAGIQKHPRDYELRIAYAKALTAAGRLEQALTVVDQVTDPAKPRWDALLVKGAVLDQMGRNAEARQLYTQGLTIAPQEASLEANLGLSYAMTNELDKAETHLRKAVRMPGATSQIRQNLALVVGLQGRFDESQRLFSAELTPDQVDANMTYIRSMLTQQNRKRLLEAQG